MDITLMAHTQLSDKFVNEMRGKLLEDYVANRFQDGQAVALSAIRTCYSHNKPSLILDIEGEKYFGSKASDGEGGTDADRLIRHIMRSKHLSTVEHITFTFAIEGVSRALLAQFTRHRVGFSFSVQSQRYVRFGSGDKSAGFDYYTPDTVSTNTKQTTADWFYGDNAFTLYETFMAMAQETYDALREAGVPAEDARTVLPNAATCNIVMTANLRALLDFYAKRKPGNGAQAEIATLAERLKDEVVAVEPWTRQFFAL